MLISVSLIDGTDETMDQTIFTVTMDVPSDTDLEQMAEELTHDFYQTVIGATSEEFQKENAEALKEINFLRWVNIIRIPSDTSTKREFLEGAKNSLVNYSSYSSPEEILSDYIL